MKQGLILEILEGEADIMALLPIEGLDRKED